MNLNLTSFLGVRVQFDLLSGRQKFHGRTMSQTVDPCDEVLSTGGSMVSDVLPLALVPVVHGLPESVR